MAADKEQLKSVILQIEKLPTLPVVVTHILNLVENANSSAADLNRTIATDQALSAKVLKLVNSAYYGFSRQISTITQAIVILGFNTVKSVALSASVFEMFSDEEAGNRGFDRTAFWEHSIGVGVAAQLIAKRVGFGQVEEAFISGIMHDVGKVILDQFLPAEFKQVLQFRDRMGFSMLEAETEALGVDHAEIGSWLADKWNLPPHLHRAIEFHHRVAEAPAGDVMAAIVHLGDLLARRVGIGNGGDDGIPELQAEALVRLRLTPPDLDALQQALEGQKQAAHDFVTVNKK